MQVVPQFSLYCIQHLTPLLQMSSYPVSQCAHGMKCLLGASLQLDLDPTVNLECFRQ